MHRESTLNLCLLHLPEHRRVVDVAGEYSAPQQPQGTVSRPTEAVKDERPATSGPARWSERITSIRDF